MKKYLYFGLVLVGLAIILPQIVSANPVPWGSGEAAPPQVNTPPISFYVYKYSFLSLATILLELVVAIIFLLIAKLPKKILWFVLLANVISLPIVWFLIPLIGLTSIWLIIISEFFAVVFEGLLIYWLSKKSVSCGKIFLLVISANAASFILGLIID